MMSLERFMFCSNCGNPLEPAARFCSFCGTFCSARISFGTPGQLVRPRSPRMIAGVCAGLAQHYGWDLGVVRLITVGVTLLTGVALFVYLAAWIILPEGQYALPTPPPPGTAPTESTPH
jgi:phage shock protein C